MFWPLGHALQHYCLLNLDTCNARIYEIIVYWPYPLTDINSKEGLISKSLDEKHCSNIQHFEFSTAPHKHFFFHNRNTGSLKYSIKNKNLISSKALKAIAAFLWAKKVPAKAKKNKHIVLVLCKYFHEHLQICVCKWEKEPNQKRMTQDAAHENRLFLWKKWCYGHLRAKYTFVTLSPSSRDQRLLEIPNFCRTCGSKINVLDRTSSLLDMK